MKIINRKNFISILCITFTIIVLLGVFLDVTQAHRTNPSQFNIIFQFICCFVSIFVLSQHYRFEFLSPIWIIIIQYVIATSVIFLLAWFISLFTPISPGGYRDLFISFSVPYIIGIVYYYIKLYIEVKKNNEILKNLQKNNRKQNGDIQ